jgi:ankyrin repeat protein
MLSTYTNSIHCINLLLDYKAQTCVANNHKFTALMGAASRNHKDICKLFINRHCELEKTSKNGHTALLYAADQGFTNINSIINSNINTNTNTNY